MTEEAVGVVLAGGSSARLGQDKSRLRIDRGGRSLTLAAWAVERLGAVVDQILVAGGDRSLAELGVEGSELISAVSDGAGRGPAAGLLGAAAAAPGRALLALACDLPRVPRTVLERLEQSRGDWVVPCHGTLLETTCALYRAPALERLVKRVARGQCSLQTLAREAGLAITTLGANELDIAEVWDEVFLNLNRPRDLARLEELDLAGRASAAER